MRTQLLKCIKCNRYTLQQTCLDCGVPTITPIPPRYSPQDKYGDYRRRAKKEALSKKP